MLRLTCLLLTLILAAPAFGDAQEDRLTFLQAFIEQDVLRSMNVEDGQATLVAGELFTAAAERSAMEDLVRTALEYLNGIDASAVTLQILDSSGTEIGTYSQSEGLHLNSD